MNTNRKSKRTMDKEIRRLLRKDCKLSAVKYVKEQTEWGLAESKNYVDQIQYGEQVGVRVFKKEAPAKRKGQDWYNQYKDKPGIVITVEKEEEDKP